jgi:hypothetical protein
MVRHVLHGLVALAAVAALGVGVAYSQNGAAADDCVSSADSLSWRGTILPYGIRDYAVTYCGPETLDLYAGAEWNGSKNLSVALIEPDGTQHVFKGTRSAGGELDAPLESGTYTIVVRNGTTSNVKFTAEVSFE